MKDQNRTYLPRDPHYCSQMIAEGLERADQNDIEQGLTEAYDLFVDYTLEDRHGHLMSLGRDLNAAYFPHRFEGTKPFSTIVSYLGQIRALINLCDYVTQRLVPEDLWQVVSCSKYAKPIMKTLQNNGAMLATELSTHAGLPHPTQLQRTAQPLVDKGLIRRERFGKNVWYSLTATGRLMATKYFGIEDINTLDSIFPVVLSKLMTGWQNINDLANDIRVNLPTDVLRSLLVSILTGLHRFGIVEEENDNWRIASRLPGEKQDLVDISKYPKLVSATHIIEKEYEKPRLGGVSDKNSIDKARKILEEVSTEVMTDKTEPHALQVKIILERAKCSALDGDWQTAFTLMGKAEAAAQTHDIDAGLLHAELRSVWSYTEAACLDPELVQVDNCITQRDYSQIRDALLIVHRLLHLSQPWNSAAHFATKLLRIALDMTRALEESQREYEPIIEGSITQRQQVDYEKEEAKSIIGGWQPAQEIENRMLSVKFR